MTEKILDGKKIANQIIGSIQQQIPKNCTRPPKLAAILTTDNPASEIYVSRKVEACHRAGFLSEVHRTTKERVVECIATLNQDKSVDGILLQLPLPHGISPIEIVQHIDPSKDVDGFHPMNIGKVLIGAPDCFYPCTPLGILTLLNAYHISPESKHVVIVGRSNIVGKPLAAMLMQNKPHCNATVTVAHSKTKNLKELCLSADILVAAVGHQNTITADMVQTGAVVIDVGINRIEGSRKVVGDVDFHAVVDRCRAITPVPGGIGPMTIATLLQNTLQSFLHRI